MSCTINQFRCRSLRPNQWNSSVSSALDTVSSALDTVSMFRRTSFAVPRFYFSLDDGQRIEDQSGNELPDLKVAKDIAGMLSRKFAQTDVANKTPSKWYIVVTDEEGQEVHRA